MNYLERYRELKRFQADRARLYAELDAVKERYDTLLRETLRDLEINGEGTVFDELAYRYIEQIITEDTK